jgi:hypothetical protein
MNETPQQFLAADHTPAQRPAPGAICAHCKTRPATTVWVGDGGVMAFIHGAGEDWCRRCVLEAQLAHAQAMEQQIPVLRRELAAIDDTEAKHGA